jgi:hypothetical protein
LIVFDFFGAAGADFNGEARTNGTQTFGGTQTASKA